MLAGQLETFPGSDASWTVKSWLAVGHVQQLTDAPSHPISKRLSRTRKCRRMQCSSLRTEKEANVPIVCSLYVAKTGGALQWR